MIRSGLRFSIAQDGLDHHDRLDRIRQKFIGEYRLEYREYDIYTDSVYYEMVFDNDAEYTAFLLRYD
jgi:hypothetical protein